MGGWGDGGSGEQGCSAGRLVTVLFGPRCAPVGAGHQQATCSPHVHPRGQEPGPGAPHPVGRLHAR